MEKLREDKKHNLCKTCSVEDCLLKVTIESCRSGVRVCAMYEPQPSIGER